MTGKTCVITGATSGVGLEAAKQFAQKGARIVMVCRNNEKALAVRSEIMRQWDVTVDIVLADFSRLDEVRRAAATLLADYPRIDVLVNNAGLHSTRRIETPEGFELVFCVDHLAAFLFTHLLLDRMIESAPARILMINSEGHRFGGLRLDDLDWEKRHYTGLRGYGAAKTAQLLTTWEFADRLNGTGVTINAMHPGDVRTQIGNNNGWLYRFFLHHFIWLILKDPVISGEAICYLASDPELEAVSGRFFHLTIDEKPASHAMDRAIGKMIWDRSIELTGL